jgi:hypothetical protein
MTERSARFALPYILPGQAQKEAYHNEALAALDGLVHAAVEGAAAAIPPAAPEPGQCWIVAAGATGPWAEQQDRLAIWTSGGWRFLAPAAGMKLWDKAAGHWRYWTGSAWSDGRLPSAGLLVGGHQVVGTRCAAVPSPSGGTIIDVEARAAIAALIVALKSHGLTD